ncbi:Glycolipid transfer protein [Quillaja saponaria]|uniref:Glycolipid transfer protein n=1 Tax=Quillaja saponaria TaxID=32244 RepID=A0AAD7LWI2_QUISA|nr:Glycolipid transfer protein [Quillaja saponaria]
MKRRRDMEKDSEVRSAIEELSMLVKINHNDNYEVALIPTKPFLYVCKLVLQVLDKIGPTMAVLRQDIHQNIQRLEMMHESNPSMYSNLLEILKKEQIEGNAKKGNTCSKSFVWLTRSVGFATTLLQKLVTDPGQNMEQAVEECYNITLKPWHGWISSAASKVALKLVPDGKAFIELLMTKDKNYDSLKVEMHTLISLLVPFLEELHSIQRVYDLDKLKSI